MTKMIDHFWIARGLSREELTAIKGRTAAYLGLMAMGLTSLALTVGIVSNVAATV